MALHYHGNAKSQLGPAALLKGHRSVSRTARELDEPSSGGWTYDAHQGCACCLTLHGIEDLNGCAAAQSEIEVRNCNPDGFYVNTRSRMGSPHTASAAGFT